MHAHRTSPHHDAAMRVMSRVSRLKQEDVGALDTAWRTLRLDGDFREIQEIRYVADGEMTRFNRQEEWRVMRQACAAMVARHSDELGARRAVQEILMAVLACDMLTDAQFRSLCAPWVAVVGVEEIEGMAGEASPESALTGYVFCLYEVEGGRIIFMDWSRDPMETFNRAQMGCSERLAITIVAARKSTEWHEFCVLAAQHEQETGAGCSPEMIQEWLDQSGLGGSPVAPETNWARHG